MKNLLWFIYIYSKCGFRCFMRTSSIVTESGSPGDNKSWLCHRATWLYSKLDITYRGVNCIGTKFTNHRVCRDLRLFCSYCMIRTYNFFVYVMVQGTLIRFWANLRSMHTALLLRSAWSDSFLILPANIMKLMLKMTFNEKFCRWSLPLTVFLLLAVLYGFFFCKFSFCFLVVDYEY